MSAHFTSIARPATPAPGMTPEPNSPPRAGSAGLPAQDFASVLDGQLQTLRKMMSPTTDHTERQSKFTLLKKPGRTLDAVSKHVDTALKQLLDPVDGISEFLRDQPNLQLPVYEKVSQVIHRAIQADYGGSLSMPQTIYHEMAQQLQYRLTSSWSSDKIMEHVCTNVQQVQDGYGSFYFTERNKSRLVEIVERRVKCLPGGNAVDIRQVVEKEVSHAISATYNGFQRLWVDRFMNAFPRIVSKATQRALPGMTAAAIRLLNGQILKDIHAKTAVRKEICVAFSEAVVNSLGNPEDKDWAFKWFSDALAQLLEASAVKKVRQWVNDEFLSAWDLDDRHWKIIQYTNRISQEIPMPFSVADRRQMQECMDEFRETVTQIVGEACDKIREL